MEASAKIFRGAGYGGISTGAVARQRTCNHADITAAAGISITATAGINITAAGGISISATDDGINAAGNPLQRLPVRILRHSRRPVLVTAITGAASLLLPFPVAKPVVVLRRLAAVTGRAEEPDVVRVQRQMRVRAPRVDVIGMELLRFGHRRMAYLADPATRLLDRMTKPKPLATAIEALCALVRAPLRRFHANPLVWVCLEPSAAPGGRFAPLR